ncbi:epidermal growth factor receptor substrate 15 isoform X2 [Bufo gargarizans]|uniref:epidermal growth factor receptor substrate 15 isoform X2 n=1 Tax=Bufo gargarizans TaxID=30331 RepID=UPI001CF5CD6F|nr:epidermal growth factor receptor substrate 15 isoform X2 [Bufo gargarizans]
MAASLPRTQIPSNNAVYEKYFLQVESKNSGKVLAGDAALFLKKSGLPDLVLGKIWDLADTEGKGYLNKQEFFAALQLVACAQNGMEVSLGSLKKVVPPPRFHDMASPPLLAAPVPVDSPWPVKPEEKAKYDAIFDSLSPVNGFLSGDKVKPVLLNSKLPVEVLGRVWELSDIDHDGLLDRDEFAVAMFLVYSALEKEPVPMILPPALVPPSKRKTSGAPSSLPIIPPLPMPPSKEPRHSLPPVGILPTKAPATQWVVSHVEKAKYDEIFVKLDKDQDGLLSGLEVKEIFLKTGLPPALLAHIWSLCDTKDCGKLSKEQFALSFHLINQKLLKGTDPPQSLTPEMLPPSERSSTPMRPGPYPMWNVPCSYIPGPVCVPSAPSPVSDFSAIKELDTLNNEIVDLQREKTNVEQELKEKEDTVKKRTSEVQDLQDEVLRENANLQNLQAQKLEIEEVLAGLDEQKATLESQLQELRLQCAEETKLISLLQTEVSSQETQISSYEEEVSMAKEELNRLQEETAQLEEKLEQGKERLTPLEHQLLECKEELRLAKLQDVKPTENHVNDQFHINWRHHLDLPVVNGTGDHSSLSNSSSEPANLHETTEYESLAQPENHSQSSPVRSSPEITHTSGSEGEEKDEAPSVPAPAEQEVTFHVDPFEVQQSAPAAQPAPEAGLDFFQNDPFVGSDPFKDDPFGKTDPFGGDPFKDSDPFASDVFFKQSPADLFSLSKADPFSSTSADSLPSAKAEKSDPFTSSKVEEADPFISSKSDPFSSSKADPFSEDPFTSFKADPFSAPLSDSSLPSNKDLKASDPFAPGGGTFVPATSETGHDDPFASVFGNESFGSGFADFSALSKNSSADTFEGTLPLNEKETLNIINTFEAESSQTDTPPALPPKTGTPTRPCPPPPGQRPYSKPEDLFKQGDPFQAFNLSFPSEVESDNFIAFKGTGEAGSHSSFNTYQSEDDMIEWAKRESEREEEERLQRLKQQEQEDLELAIALSKSEISEA